MPHDAPREARSVCFSPNEQVFDIPGDNAALTYYSPSDIERFRVTLAQDVQRMATLFSTTPHEFITLEQLYDCIGIEMFLSHNIAIHTAAAIHAHREVVILGQDLLAPEALSRVSRASSQWFRSKAQRLALSYLENLTD